jgi:hypothetical protein
MNPEAPQRLTGEAAWKAAKERVAKHNQATQARARDARLTRDAAAAARRLAAEREELTTRPAPPTGR